jgi:hypothetical protein
MPAPDLTKGFKELLPAVIALGLFLFPATRFDFELNSYSVLAIFTAAFTVYFADHWVETSTPFPTWVIIGLLSAIHLFFVHVSTQFSLLGIFTYVWLALLYVLPCLPKEKRLQDLPQVRVLAIVTGWTALPLLHQDFPITWTSGGYLLGVAGCLIPNIIWCDLADVEADHTSGRPTWVMHQSPALIRHTLWFCLFISLLGFVLSNSYLMIPVPLAYLLLEPKFRNTAHTDKADWILLWPLVASVMA